MTPQGPPPLAEEILDTIVSSFQPARDRQRVSIDVDQASLRGKPLVVSRLLTENPWEKAALAELYERYVIRESRGAGTTRWASIWRAGHAPRIGQSTAIFIESGSTCACVAEIVRRFAANHNSELRPFQLGTNNHLAAWLFLNRELTVAGQKTELPQDLVPYLFAGQLESKYHGIFPFHRTRHDDKVTEERSGYAQLRLTLARSNLLLLAASRLSLKYGPLVGSRENAIFKNACYNACVPPIGRECQTEIHLFLTVQKLVAHARDNEALLSQPASDGGGANTFADFHTWVEELGKIGRGKCFPAFDLHLADDQDRPGNWAIIHSPFSKEIAPDTPQRLRDGTSAVEMGDGRFRICHGWPDLFSKAGLSVRVFVSLPGNTDPSSPYVQWVEREVDHAKAALKGSGVTFDLTMCGTLVPTGATEEYSMASIEICPRS
jgi:hypothetical protein